MPREAEWVIPLGQGVQKRHWHISERGRVIGFAVQLELWADAEWQPIVRYDASHGFAHRDVYETRTRKRKENLKLDFRAALTFADRDIDRNWQRYADAFRRRNKL